MTREEAITWCDRFNDAWANADPKDDFPDLKYSDTLDQLFYLAGKALRTQQELESKLKVVESNEPLTLDELRKMDAPVWLRCYQVDGDGYWCLCKNGIIITPAGNRYDVSEIPHWAFYRQKPEEGEK